MLKVLLSYVGVQDPFSEQTNEEGSILALCRFLKPDVVYLIPTASGLNINSSTEENAELTRDWIIDFKKDINTDVQIFINSIKLEDPTDYSAILPKARSLVGEILQELSEFEYELHINCSSGTPQLKNSWMIMANGGVFDNPQLYQVGNPKYCTERIKKLELTFLEEENTLHRIRRNIDEFLFQKIAEECGYLKRVSCYSYRKEKAGLLERIFSAYQSWDLIQYNDAYQRLKSVYYKIRHARDLDQLSEVLEQQVSILAKLHGQETRENRYNLLDLFNNARRRFVRRDYTDTLSRFWRIYEGTLYHHLRENYQVEPSDITKSENRKNAKLIRDYFTEQKNYCPNRLSMRDAEKVLEYTFRDKTFKTLEDFAIEVCRGNSKESVNLIKIINELRKSRNDSIVAHGMRPVSKDDAVNSLLVMEKILGIFFDDIFTESYPLNRDNTLVVLSVLENTFAAG